MSAASTSSAALFDPAAGDGRLSCGEETDRVRTGLMGGSMHGRGEENPFDIGMEASARLRRWSASGLR
jgi:hypothetical protein